MLFALTSGPEIRPPQSGSQFGALPAGTYQVMVTNFSNDTALVNATVGGTYQFPDFAPTFVHPFCDNSATGKIVGNAKPNMGTPPFTWELLNTATNVTVTQTSDTFLNLPAGEYRLRQIDSCQSFATRYITLQDPHRTFDITSYRNTMVTCDTVDVEINISAPGGNYAPPYTIQVQTPNGTYQHPLTNISYGGWYPVARERVGGVGYGDVITITITDACGQSTSKINGIYDFHFFPNYFPYWDSCQLKYQVHLLNLVPLVPNSAVYQQTFMLLPVNVVISDPVTDTIVDSFVMTNTTTRPVLPSGQTYKVHIEDQCGNSYTSTISVPTPPITTPVFLKKVDGTHCLDSTASIRLTWRNYFTSFPTFELLSGPSTISSSKPKYAYHDTVIYPQSSTVYVDPPQNGNTGYLTELTNLGVGTYHYRVTDTCGKTVVDSFTIYPNDVSNYYYQLSYTKGCPGQNTLNLTTNSNVMRYWEADYEAGSASWHIMNTPTVVNLDHGEYYVTLNYHKVNPGAKRVNETLTCQVVKDTVVIPPYEQPEIAYAAQIQCNGSVNVGLYPDSSKGVPPYSYEILSGPETAAVQASQFFTLTQPGNYVARISDTCGFARTFSFFVDTLSLLQVVNAGAYCFGESAVLVSEPSPYATYIWQKPDGSFFTGDSLHINPITFADYGLYEVTKIIDVNNCRDTVHTTYELKGTSITYSSAIICSGDSISFGGNNYSVAGTYYDTIPTSLCDSIVVLNLTVSGGSDSVSFSICLGQSVTVGSNDYSASGIYRDTLQTSQGCDSIVTLTLTVIEPVQSNISQSICAGNSYFFAGQNLTQSGIYRDTLPASQGCDSIVTFTLTVIEPVQNNISQSICTGNSYFFAGQNLTQSGIYHDTLLASQGCDSIVTLVLTVNPPLQGNIAQTLCAGSSYWFNGENLTQSGIYKDTLQTSQGCDSIITLDLVILPHKSYHIYDTICEGASYVFGGLEYTNQGVYTQTFPTSSCDSTVILHLTTVPKPSVFITSAILDSYNGSAKVQLNAISATFPLTYFWESNAVLSNNTISNPTATIKESEVVTLTVTDKYGCYSTVGYRIELSVTSTLYVPNSFTPDGDQYNNIFKVYGTNIADFYLLIFDRWGEIIFESYNMDYGWDGTYKGKIVQDGVYVYKVLATGIDGVRYDKTGHVTVLK